MPNMIEENEIPFYYDPENISIAQNVSVRLAGVYHLALRSSSSIKDYGRIKEDADYSEFFVSWDDFTDEYLQTKKTLKNPAYSLYRGIYARCYDPNSIGYYYYGELGIKMDERWKANFTTFVVDIMNSIGRKPKRFYSIDRIDNSGNYVLGNIRWAAPIKQSRHKRGTKINEFSGLVLAKLYKYYQVTGKQLKEIYNSELADNDSQITKGWGPIYNACKTYCQFV